MLFHNFSHQLGQYTVKSSQHIFIKNLEGKEDREEKRGKKRGENTFFYISFGSYFEHENSNQGMIAMKALSFDLFFFWVFCCCNCW